MSDTTGVPAALVGFLAATGITWRQLDYWERSGHIRADHHEAPRSGGHTRTWSPAELRVARDIGRLIAAGLCLRQAAVVARHPTGGPVVLGPGIVLSLFEPRAQLGEASRGQVMWREAGDGDTPGALTPGEDDVTTVTTQPTALRNDSPGAGETGAVASGATAPVHAGEPS